MYISAKLKLIMDVNVSFKLIKKEVLQRFTRRDKTLKSKADTMYFKVKPDDITHFTLRAFMCEIS